MKFHEWFPQRLMQDYGLEGRVYGEQYYIKDGEEMEEEVKDPYATPETSMRVEIRGKVREQYDRDKMIMQISKPHMEYDNDARYRFVMHQIKYKAVRDTLGYVVNPNNAKKFFNIKKKSSEEFEGIDISTNEHVKVTREGFEQELPKRVLKTHAEQFARGYHPETGIVCVPIGIYNGSIFYNKIEWYGALGARVELARFHADSGQIKKENIIIVLADNFKSIATTLATDVEVPWGNLVKHTLDLWRNPLNKEIWHLLPPCKVYDGNHVFMNYSGNRAFIKVVDQWMPTNLTWLLSHRSTFLKEVEDEIRVVVNIANLEGAQA